MSDGPVIERDFVQNMALRNTIGCLLGSGLLRLYKRQCSTWWSGKYRTFERHVCLVPIINEIGVYKYTKSLKA
jgi:hypothetical protein